MSGMAEASRRRGGRWGFTRDSERTLHSDGVDTKIMLDEGVLTVILLLLLLLPPPPQLSVSGTKRTWAY